MEQISDLGQFQREKTSISADFFFFFGLFYRQALLKEMETRFYVVSSHLTGIDMMREKQKQGEFHISYGSKKKQGAQIS